MLNAIHIVAVANDPVTSSHGVSESPVQRLQGHCVS